MAHAEHALSYPAWTIAAMTATSTPTLIDVDGWPAWRLPDGRIRPHVRGGEGDDEKDDKGKGDEDEKDDKGGDDGKGKGGPVSFTPEQQAHIDSLIAKQHGKAKATAEKEFKAWLDQQAMGETERAKAESAAKDKLVEEAKLEALTTKVETAAERAALAAGVKPERVAKFMRLVDLKDLDKVTDDGKPDADAIKALVEKELEDAPEFKGGAGTGDDGKGKGGKSGGEFTPNGGKVWTRAEISKMSPEEYEKHEDEILKQLASPAGIK